jgi:hypothetical protein
MKLFFLVIFFSNIAFANTIFESNQLNNIDYLEKLKEAEKFDFSVYSKNRIFLMYAYNNITAGRVDNIKCNKLNFEINKFNLLISALKKYDLNFLNKINANYLVLCENLKINNYLASGFANSNFSTIIIDFSIDKNFIERAIHHEIFHIISSNNNTKLLNESWLKKNDDNFIYKKCSNCNSSYSTKLSDEHQGFLTDYSMHSMSEDQAEVFSVWMSDINIFNSLIENDDILKNKINILKKFLYKINFSRND